MRAKCYFRSTLDDTGRVTGKVICIETQIYGCSALCDNGDDLAQSHVSCHSFKFVACRDCDLPIILLSPAHPNTMFEDICLVCGKPLQDAGYASVFPHRPSSPNLSFVVGRTAVTTVRPMTFPLLQYRPLAAHALPQT